MEGEPRERGQHAPQQRVGPRDAPLAVDAGARERLLERRELVEHAALVVQWRLGSSRVA